MKLRLALFSTESELTVSLYDMVDFKDHLRRQLGFIQKSCELYDKGDPEEAVRIAVALRVIFHRTKASVSLLTHLNANSIQLLSTRTDFLEDPISPNLPLIQLKAHLNLVDDNKKAEFQCHAFPRLGETIRKDLIPFERWWEQEYVIKHKEPPTTVSRKDLVLAAANKDGGAHVDEALDPVYDYVRLGSGLGLSIVLNPKLQLPDQEGTFKNIHFATLRQIAFEVLNSPQLLDLR